MFEELISSGENITDSPHEKIMVLKNEMNEGWNQTLAKAETVVNISKSYDSNSIRSLLAELVPEYRSVNIHLSPNLSLSKASSRLADLSNSIYH